MWEAKDTVAQVPWRQGLPGPPQKHLGTTKVTIDKVWEGLIVPVFKHRSTELSPLLYLLSILKDHSQHLITLREHKK